MFTGAQALALSPPDPFCSPEIAACHCVINEPGFYQLTDNIFSPPTTKAGNCIDIKASGTVLELNGYGMLDASNSGVGIDVYKQALNTTIEGRTTANGYIGSVRGFDIDIEDNADNALIEGIYAAGNNTAAFMLRNVKNSR